MALTGYNFVQHNFKEYIRGSDFIGLLIEDKSTGRDLTGATIDIWFRDTDANGTILKQIAVGSGITITDGVNDIFQIDPFELDFDVDIIYYDVKKVYSDGFKRKPLFGIFNLKEDSTDG